MHCFPLPIGVVAACGAGYRFDPTPNPSFREGLVAARPEFRPDYLPDFIPYDGLFYNFTTQCFAR